MLKNKMNQSPLLIYLHGLNSSPASQKAIQTADYIRQQNAGINIDVEIPHLPTEPDDVITRLKSIAEPFVSKRPIYIIGSSLGGYLGTWLHQHLLQQGGGYPVRLVLINPAVMAYNLFEQFIGPQENLYTGEKWEMTHTHAEKIKALEVEQLRQPDSILLLAQTGDEILDYRLAVEKYRESPSIIEEGGDHSFIDYKRHLPFILKFLTCV